MCFEIPLPRFASFSQNAFLALRVIVWLLQNMSSCRVINLGCAISFGRSGPHRLVRCSSALLDVLAFLPRPCSSLQSGTKPRCEKCLLTIAQTSYAHVCFNESVVGRILSLACGLSKTRISHVAFRYEPAFFHNRSEYIENIYTRFLTVSPRACFVSQSFALSQPFFPSLHLAFAVFSPQLAEATRQVANALVVVRNRGPVINAA